MLLSNQVAEIIKCRPLPIRILTDNESLVNAAYSTTSVEEKRLRIDVASLREMIHSKSIYDVKWVPTNKQLADCLTKQGAKSDQLLAVIKQQGALDPDHLHLMPSRHE